VLQVTGAPVMRPAPTGPLQGMPPPGGPPAFQPRPGMPPPQQMPRPGGPPPMGYRPPQGEDTPIPLPLLDCRDTRKRSWTMTLSFGSETPLSTRVIL